MRCGPAVALALLVAPVVARAQVPDPTPDRCAPHSAVRPWCPPPGASSRQIVRVHDQTGQPLAGVQVRLSADGQTLQEALTLGDGRAPLFPGLVEEGGPYHVEVLGSGARLGQGWDGAADLELTLPISRLRRAAVPLDVLFVVDTTGSMGDEIAAIKSTLLDLTSRIRALPRDTVLRYGAVFYRDVGDVYVTARVPLTTQLYGFQQTIRWVEAEGGGDAPEALNRALHEAVHDTRWRRDAARVVFLLADAPPHMDHPDPPWWQSALDATAAGVRIHTVGASGLDEAGVLVLEELAQITGGDFLTYRGAGDDELTGILFEQARVEVEGWEGG